MLFNVNRTSEINQYFCIKQYPHKLVSKQYPHTLYINIDIRVTCVMILVLSNRIRVTQFTNIKILYLYKDII